MDKLTFGITLLIVGMGGTLLTLYLLTLLIKGLTFLMPANPPQSGKEQSK
ncbi:MAG: OadG-related small transporter subunit [Opitutaceae bacterium]|jgi:Na+-transporting methylmalonyl-CoA/oxaloacetate decarboxylase gamma subunit